MSKTQSAAITKKTIADWLSVSWNDCEYRYGTSSIPSYLFHKSIPYTLEIISSNGEYLCYPCKLKEAVSAQDKKTMGQKIVKLFHERKEKEEKKKRKEKILEEKLRLDGEVKKFLATK